MIDGTAPGFDLTSPYAVMERLAEIEADLAEKQNEFEAAALAWFKAKRDREHDLAVEFARSVGSPTERRVVAAGATSGKGRDAEANYEALKGVVRVLETRASIGQSIL